MKKGLSLVELMAIVAIIGVVGAMLPLLGGGCRQQMARAYGGSMTVKLDPGMRLENCTWKADQLWLLTTYSDTTPRVHRFIEKSPLGILQGEVIIQEQ